MMTNKQTRAPLTPDVVLSRAGRLALPVLAALAFGEFSADPRVSDAEVEMLREELRAVTVQFAPKA